MAINTRQLQLQDTPGTRELPGGAVNDLLPTASGQAPELKFAFRKKVTADDRMFFTEQLALLLDTGNSLLESLHSLARHCQSPALKALIQTLAEDVEQGQPFSHAISKHPQVFSSTYVNLVKASEQGGFMAEVLDELMEMDEKRARLQATMRSALSYPAFLAVFSVAVVVFILIVVFPKFADMFGSMAEQLPPTTLALMSLSESMIAHWPFYILGTVVFGTGLYFLLRSPQVLYALDGLKLRTPVIKDVFSELYLVQSMRVMALSMGRGVSVVDTLASCRDVVSNRRYQEFFRSLENDLQEGRGLSMGFRKAEFIPDVVKQMVTTGEAGGNLPKVMNRISSYYERQLESRLQTLSSAIEPMMLVVMGGVVGVLVSSLILPIFKMSAVAH